MKLWFILIGIIVVVIVIIIIIVVISVTTTGDDEGEGTDEGTENGGTNGGTETTPTNTISISSIPNDDLGSYSYVINCNGTNYPITKVDTHINGNNDYVYANLPLKTAIRLWVRVSESLSFSVKAIYNNGVLTVTNWNSNGLPVENVELNNNTITITMQSTNQ